MHDSRLRLAVIGVGVIAAGLVLAWLLAGAVSRRVERLADAAARVGGGDLTAHVPEEGPRELRTLAGTFNRMTHARPDEAAKAEAELDRLNGLVDDLLALERASSGNSRAQPVDLSAIAREAVEPWSAAAAAEEQRLELDAASPARALTDPTDLSHVADNLIENALRYCPPGTSITISTRGPRPNTSSDHLLPEGLWAARARWS